MTKRSPVAGVGTCAVQEGSKCGACRLVELKGREDEIVGRNLREEGSAVDIQRLIAHGRKLVFAAGAGCLVAAGK